MIAYYGFSEKLANVSYYDSTGQSDFAFSRPYSDETARLIDEEVKNLIAEQYDRAKAILTENLEKMKELADILVEKEVIFADDVERIFGKRPWKSRADELSEESNGSSKTEEKKKETSEEKVEDSPSDEQEIKKENIIEEGKTDSEKTT